MKTKRDYAEKTFIGVNNGENIYLSAPSWDCGWYWGFGYLGNRGCHYHVDTMEKNVPFHEKFDKHFGDKFIVRPSQRWIFSELFKSFYVLKETAEVLGRGGAHITFNPCRNIIINNDEVKRINEIVLPEIFDAIYQILDDNKDNNRLFNELAEFCELGINNAVQYMFKNKLTPDDIKHLNCFDYNAVIREYWRQYHSTVTTKHKKIKTKRGEKEFY